MRFADMGKPTLRGGRTYSPSEVALLSAHLTQVEQYQQQVAAFERQARWQDARLRSALARVAAAAMKAGVEHTELHRLVDASSAVTTDVLTAARDHAPAYPR